MILSCLYIENWDQKTSYLVIPKDTITKNCHYHLYNCSTCSLAEYFESMESDAERIKKTITTLKVQNF